MYQIGLHILKLQVIGTLFSEQEDQAARATTMCAQTVISFLMGMTLIDGRVKTSGNLFIINLCLKSFEFISANLARFHGKF